MTLYDLCRVVQQLKLYPPTFSWAAVSRELGLPKSATSASSTLKKKYEKYIQPYESRMAHATPQTSVNSLISYLEQRHMANKLSNKFATIPDILFARSKADAIYLQLLRNPQLQDAKKPDDRVTGGADHAQQIVEFCNESQPFTDESLSDLLEKLDGVVSLTVGPLTYLTVIPNFSDLHQSLQRLIIYDLPSRLVEEVYEMAAESLPNLHTLSILASSYHAMTSSNTEETTKSTQEPPFLTETAIW